MTGVFVVLFSASILILVFVFSFPKLPLFEQDLILRNLTGGGEDFLTARQQPCLY